MKVFILSLLMTSFPLLAQDRLQVLEQEVENYMLALEQGKTTQIWVWDAVRVRTVVELGFEVPVITKFSLNPEVEFIFVKK